MRWLRIVLIVVAVACFAVALSYPIRYRMAQESNNSDMEKLSALRAKGQETAAEATAAPGTADAKPGRTAETGAAGTEAAPDEQEAPAPQMTLADEIEETPPPVEAAEGREPASTDAETARAGATDATPPPVGAGEGGRSVPDKPDVASDDAEAPRPAETREGEGPATIDPGPAQAEGSAETTPPVGQREDAPRAADIPDDAQALSTADIPDGEQGSSVTDIPDGARHSLPAATREDAPTAATDPGSPQTDGSAATPPTEGPEGGLPAATDPGTPQTGGGGQPEPPVDARESDAPEWTDEPAEAGADVPDAPRSEPTPQPEPTPVPGPTPTPDVMDLIMGFPGTPEPAPKATPRPDATEAAPVITVEPSPTPNRRVHTGALPYPLLEKVTLDPDAILPELREIYDLNHDLVGWINIPDTVIDYPVVQVKDSDFYLTHDFYKEENVNGQIILDTLCDPYTPSYNLVISGHHMKNGSMFGDLPKYASKSYWASHPFLEFDTLMARKKYVIFAAFYSADYDEDEEGFRYNADIQYRLDAELWLDEVRQNQLYDTEIDAAFGDEFITLTTCNRARRRDGRFVVVCRKIREGETFE